MEWFVSVTYFGTSQFNRINSFNLIGNKGTEVSCVLKVKGTTATITHGSPFYALEGEEEFTINYSQSTFLLEIENIDKVDHVVNINCFYNS